MVLRLTSAGASLLRGQGDWTVGETGPADRSEFAPVPERPKDDPRVARRRRR